MGSTSYDEARDPTDPRWAGASWYGPTTGEYWIVNPREYADPRKHGPGYSHRVRSGEPSASEPPSDEISRARSPEPEPLEATEPPADTPQDRPRPDQGDQPVDEPFLDSLIRPGSSDPLRRLGLVLLAWAPVGVAATAVLGQLTGCAGYSATCDGTDPYLPWVAQAIIVGLLLVAAPLARVFAAGTVGLVVGLVPATGFVIALGGAGSSAAPPVLAAVLVTAWVIGAAWGARHVVAARRGHTTVTARGAAAGPSGDPTAAGGSHGGQP